MKKIITIITLMVATILTLSAQDKIVTKDGTKITAHIVKDGDSEVQFKYWDKLNGPTLTISKDEIASIKYASGKEVILGEVQKASDKAVEDYFDNQPKAVKSKADKKKDIAEKKEKKQKVTESKDEKKEKKQKESKKKDKKDDWAEDVPAPKFQFQKNDEGDPCITGQIEYDCSSETAWKRLNSYVRTVFTSDSVEFEEEDNPRVLRITGAKEASKVRINPLIASGFGDDTWYTLTFTQKKNGEIHYVFSDLSINSIATGLANYNRLNSVRTLLRDYEKARADAANLDLSKKEHNEAVKTAKDLASSLTKAYETILERIDSIRKNVE